MSTKAFVAIYVRVADAGSASRVIDAVNASIVNTGASAAAILTYNNLGPADELFLENEFIAKPLASIIAEANDELFTQASDTARVTK